MDEWKQGTFATSNQNSSSDYLAIDRASNRLEGWMFGSKEREN
jgi:hypothetical protein